MPFIVDLPPIDYNKEQTKMEHVLEDGQRFSPEDSLDVFKVDNDLFEHVYFVEKFQALIKTWKDNTMFQSSIANIIQDESFVEMLKMDYKKLFPLIIDEIEQEPSILVWALNIMSGLSVSNDFRYTIEDICKKWVSLYRAGKINID